ncbi:helix-turn-helix domain-containing protein [Mycobacterium sp. MYCO198283]|uniref:helix-turn-helix domain-containing protein n=1 Tax=Mycobacterium sp. MYCO198283 TaxID=2883505 RepID=UPI001E4FE525|nr:helix-turn-helix domain-containing protein [Mycobacterium sp. MYCO198283]MCG5431190.1 helix-turn-helix domain-containing protein [Mycobacterium sp. MYCO198283]
MSIGSADTDRPTQQPTRYLTVNEVADHYRTTARTVQRWIREGRLPATRLPGGRSYRIRAEDIATGEASA